MKKQLFIYNSQSGKGLNNNKLNNIIYYLKILYPDIITCPTSQKGDAKIITKKFLAYIDKIFVLGGDGTINDVITAIVSSNYNPTLIIIPNGTMNDLAHFLNIPRNYKQAIDLVKTNKPQLFDIIKVNNSYAIYGFAIGRFSSASYNTSQKMKKVFGKLAYFLFASKEMLNYSPMQLDIIVDNKKLSGNFALALITNSNYVAGFNINRTGKTLPQLILITEQCNTKKLKLQSLISMIKLFLFGLQTSNKDKFTTIVSFKNLSIISNKTIPCVLDGEKNISKTYEIEIVPKQISIVHNMNKK